MNVELRGGREYDLRPLERHFYTTSACGVCGKASLEQLELRGCPVMTAGPEVSAETIYTLPEKLREAQGLFDATGGLHAAALFDQEGELVALREDVGRHNATDKLVGWALLEGRLPLTDHIVMVSGRSSFEILQKSPDGRGARRVRHLRPEQPRRRRGQGVRHDARRLPARRQVQRLRGKREDKAVEKPGARHARQLTAIPP